MSVKTATRRIQAPVETVFATVSQIEHYSKAIPSIVNVVFFTHVTAGVGTRFRETRANRGHESTMEFEIKELVENKMVRFASHMGGAIWDKVITTEPDAAGTTLTVRLAARPRSVGAFLTGPVALGLTFRALERDLNAIRDYCEGLSASPQAESAPSASPEPTDDGAAPDADAEADEPTPEDAADDDTPIAADAEAAESDAAPAEKT